MMFITSYTPPPRTKDCPTCGELELLRPLVRLQIGDLTGSLGEGITILRNAPSSMDWVVLVIRHSYIDNKYEYLQCLEGQYL